MAPFHYRARDNKGTVVEGTMEADSRNAVVARLQQMGCYPISVDQHARKGRASAIAEMEKGASKASMTRLPSTAAKPRPKGAGEAVGGWFQSMMGGGGSTPSGSVAAKPKAPMMGRATTVTMNRPAMASSPGVAKLGPSLGGPAARTSTTMVRKPTPASSPSGATAAAPTIKAHHEASVSSGSMFSRGRVRTADLAAFNRQMADLLGSGIALVKALTIMAKQTPNERLRQIITQINTDVQGGATFADALGSHPSLFSKLYVAMVRSGEAGGNLDEVLQKLADYSESEEELKGRITSALAYPTVMIVAGTGAVIVMFVYVVPKIVGTFRELNQALPGPTLLLIAISDVFQNYWYIVLGLLAAAIVAAYNWVRTDVGRATWHRWQLRIPIFGDLVAKREVARFSRTLGSLLKNGVSILTALGITRDVLTNSIVKTEVDRVIEEITQGASIATPLRDSVIFPPVVVNMMSVGEETGQLEHVLLRISASFELEVDRRIKTLTSLIEPLIIVAIGCVVAFIVVAMLLPIFSLDPSGGM